MNLSNILQICHIQITSVKGLYFSTLRFVMAVSALLVSKAGNQFLNSTNQDKAWKHCPQSPKIGISKYIVFRVSMFTWKCLMHQSCLESLFEIKMV